jgi:hypothetical protein
LKKSRVPTHNVRSLFDFLRHFRRGFSAPLASFIAPPHLQVAGDLFEARNGHRCMRADMFLSELALHMPVGDPVDAARSLFLPSREASRTH